MKAHNKEKYFMDTSSNLELCNILTRLHTQGFHFSHTVFNLITAYTPISAQSSNFIVFRLQPVYFLKANVVGIHLNCIDKYYAFIKKITKKKQNKNIA